MSETKQKAGKAKPWCVIMKREISAYFQSPVAYIVGALFLLASGIMFFSTFFIIGRADMREFFSLLPVLFTFFIPAMTMRMFSEEKRSGTMETLVTLPVTTRDIVAGKYLASLVSAAVMLAPTLFYAATCAAFGVAGADPGPMVGGYVGALLLAAAFCAIGLFASSVTPNQIVSFFLAAGVCAVLTFVSYFAVLLPGAAARVAAFISSTSHFEQIARGVIDSRDIIYFLSLAAVFLLLTARSVERAKRG